METDWDDRDGPRSSSARKRCWTRRGRCAHGFYTSGQLFLEEYYTLAVIGKAGLGTPHMDGNTRLCTATGAAALKETFGADGQPGSYTDIDHCDAIFLYGHNMAETQTVLWTRMLDRTRGDDPPRIVCVDPRRTPVAEEAERTGGVHLAPRVGTNLALMNGLMRELFANGWVDEDVGQRAHHRRRRAARDGRARTRPSSVAEICGVDADDVRRAARIFGESERRAVHGAAGLLPVAPGDRGVVAVNNLHLLRGHDRPARRRHPADERPADRAEQPRVRRRRRPAGLPQLGQPGARPAAGRRCGTSTR